MPLSFSLFKIDCSKSAASTNNKGEIRSPYLTLLLQWITFPNTPFSKIEEVPVCIIIFIQLSHLFPKPFACRISNINECSTLSKAFSKSNLKKAISFFDFFAEMQILKRPGQAIMNTSIFDETILVLMD